MVSVLAALYLSREAALVVGSNQLPFCPSHWARFLETQFKLDGELFTGGSFARQL